MIGRNGSGKTVLFKCICGFLRVDDGAVLVDGKQIGKEIEAPEEYWRHHRSRAFFRDTAPDRICSFSLRHPQEDQEKGDR